MRTAIQQLSYILILLTIFSSCNKDNEKEIIEESYEMNIKVEYTYRSEFIRARSFDYRCIRNYDYHYVHDGGYVSPD